MTDEHAKELIEKMRTCRDEIIRRIAKYTAYKMELEQSGRHVPKEVFVKVLLS